MPATTQIQMPLIPPTHHLCFPDGTPDARAIRKTAFPGMSVDEVSSLLRVPARTYGSWERKECEPSGAARSLLKLAAAAPDLVRQILLAHAEVEGNSLTNA